MEGLKIMDIDVECFKNIKKKIVHLDGRSLVILGGNGAGKSSFIQSILSPLDSSYIPPNPVMEGEERASIKLKIAGELFGEYKSYNLDLYFTPGNQTGRLVVTNHLGEQVKAAKSLIKSLIGNIGFDIFQFIQSSPAKQVETLKELAGVDFNDLDMKRKEIYDKRSYVNKRIEEEQTLLGNSGFTDDQIEKYSKPVDVTEFKSQMANISKATEDYVKVEIGMRDKEKANKELLVTISENEQKIKDYEVQIIKLQEAIEINRTTVSNNDRDMAKGEAWLKANLKPSANDIQAQLSVAEQHNENYNKINAYAAKSNALIKLKQESSDLSDTIKMIDEDKQNMIKNSKLPIEGLSFNEKCVLLDGLEFSELQINKSRIIKVGFLIGLSMNPNLRVAIINDGSLLDKEQITEVLNLAQEHNCQILIEKVLEDGGELDVKFTEEYLK